MRNINDYFKKQIDSHGQGLRSELLERFAQEAEKMSSLGINCPEDQALYFALTTQVPAILHEVKASSVTPEEADKCICEIYRSKKDLPLGDTRGWIYSVAKIGDRLGFPLKDGPKNLLISGPKLQTKKDLMDKAAYPEGGGGKFVPPPYNLTKWVQASARLHTMMHSVSPKMGFTNAFDQVTQGWEPDEVENFQFWLRFYGSGEENKYKLAQMQIPFNQLRSQLPQGSGIPGVPATIQTSSPGNPHPDPSRQIQRRPDSPQQLQALRERIENQRQKIISRLNAAEKLLTTPEGQMFCGNELEDSLKILHELKLKIQTAQKISVSSTLFEDFIYRTGNLLRAYGKKDLGNFFIKVAQTGDVPPIDDYPTPDAVGPGQAAPPSPENVAGGPVDFLEGDTAPPMEGGNTPPPTPADEAPEEPKDEKERESAAKKPTKDTVQLFFKALKEPELNYTSDGALPKKKSSADIEVFAQALLPGQQAATPLPVPAAAAVPAPPPQIQVSAPPQEVEEMVVTDTPDRMQVDEVLEEVLSSVTIEDVLERVEEVEAEYKRRETARKLSIIDLMMNRLGIGGFFPSLGESMGKALEANQYIGTRLEDIASRIRAAVEEIDTSTERPQFLTPESRALRSELNKQDEIADLRREKRREKEDKKLMGPDASPSIGDLQTELQQPIKVQSPGPVPPINPGEHVPTVPITPAQVAAPPQPPRGG